jgi:hypothetical protein
VVKMLLHWFYAQPRRPVISEALAKLVLRSRSSCTRRVVRHVHQIQATTPILLYPIPSYYEHTAHNRAFVLAADIGLRTRHCVQQQQHEFAVRCAPRHSAC